MFNNKSVKGNKEELQAVFREVQRLVVGVPLEALCEGGLE